ncbi:MAG: alpha/beta fold hydrolase, partial [Actinobacteria bacterium]|nr:alpha/beta fold hydrolase [Actinomycetota bacterium]
AVFGRQLTVADLFVHPTVAALAERLGGDGGADRSAMQVLLPLRTRGERPPLFCVHALFGLAWPYAGLARHLDADRPLYGLQARGLAERAPLPGSLEDMAADYVEQVRSVQPAGPYHLLGWSFGGLVAHTMAAQLQWAGETVALLALVDSYPLTEAERSSDDTEDEQGALAFLARLAGLDPVPHGGGLDRGELLAAVRHRGLGGAVDDETISAMVDVAANAGRLMRTARHRHFDGDVVFFTATADKSATSLSPRRWEPFVGGAIENYDVDCTHLAMTDPDALALWGPVLDEKLAKTTGAGPGTSERKR